MSFFWEKEGKHLPSPIVLITCIKTSFSPVVFLGSYNFCDVVFYIICHDVLYQFWCIAHVWWVTIKDLLTYFLLTYHHHHLFAHKTMIQTRQVNNWWARPTRLIMSTYHFLKILSILSYDLWILCFRISLYRQVLHPIYSELKIINIRSCIDLRNKWSNFNRLLKAWCSAPLYLYFRCSALLSSLLFLHIGFSEHKSLAAS